MMEEQKKPMSNDEEELFNRYFAKIKAATKKLIDEKKDLKEYVRDGRNYAIRGFMSGNCNDIEQMVANSLAATFRKRKENSF